MTTVPTVRLQKRFNRAWYGLAAQGFLRAQCTDGRAGVLLDATGRKCALGHLLSTPLVVGQAWSPAAHRLMQGKHAGFYDALITAHEVAETPEQLHAALVGVAARYGLEMPQ